MLPASLEKSKTNPFNHALNAAFALSKGDGLKVSGLFGSSRAFFVANAFREHKRTVLCVLPTEKDAEAFARDLAFFLSEETVCLFPSTELLPFEPHQAHQDIQSKRIETLYRLLNPKTPAIAVSSAENLMQRVMPKAALFQKEILIELCSEHPRDALMAALHDMGYSRMTLVEERAEFSVRGAILDIYPPNLEDPVRIDFFGDEVESIRLFDIATQRSRQALEAVKILPAKEALPARENMIHAIDKVLLRAEELDLERPAWEGLRDRLKEGRSCQDLLNMPSMLPLFYPALDTVFNYLPEDALAVFINPEAIEKEMLQFDSELNKAASALRLRKKFFADPKELYLNSAEFASNAKNLPCLLLTAITGAGIEVPARSNMDLMQSLKLNKSEEAPLAPLVESIRLLLEQGQGVFLTAHNAGHARRTIEILEGYGFTPPVIRGADIIEKKPRGFSIALGEVSTGFSLEAAGVSIVSEEEVFGERVKQKPPPRRGLDEALSELKTLKEGGFVVHKVHGIGAYRGLKRLDVSGVENDFLVIEYRDDEKLYLPVFNMDLISGYKGLEGRAPMLDKLGGSGWEKRKKRVKKATERLAGELLKLYAERQVASGFAFSAPDALFKEFEEGFEYTETPDQARAIEECLNDMTTDKPMDRLVCGDVGYGKTEVAIRASFKAALDGKQTAVLVPTTVLAQQHFLTFSKRLAPFPVKVDVLSRFKTHKEQRAVIERVKSGAIDIIIGTHRLLQKDLGFKELGLIVIDEEHRFGVAHKERLKSLKKTVDVLTLTATPIPRTLQMSIAGLREISIINTPPEDRLSIKTSVIRFDDSMIAEAIERERKRGGQVFFVHNRIQSMGPMKEYIERIAPGVKVAVAHGQMREAELERMMLGFVNREYELLLSTAIIESGLDIPSANTIIINRADRFGLAELYQLRGRVGRSSHRAYAYFICPDPLDLSDDARKRMEVIQELSEPGSGFKVAAYDLEIRGAGEMLGTTQSGFIIEVGFDMYTELLKLSVAELRGEEIKEEEEPEISLKVSQYIPEEYIPDTAQRLTVYKRLASVATDAELDAIRDELMDIYGPPPALADNVVETMRLKLALKKLHAKELKEQGQRLYLRFADLSGIKDGKRIADRALKLSTIEPRRYRLAPDSRFIVMLSENEDAISASRSTLKEFLKA